ncbi:MAG: hypothetical protein O7G86_16130 [Gammaproteobacteria bacterium]|nr:hypothetical protein [Gammaproteobacteria bacterium]
MSILQASPGARIDNGTVVFLFSLLLMASGLLAPIAHGFTLRPANGNPTTTINLADILQGGSNLTGSAEQVYPLGTVSRTLNDFSMPVDVNLTGSVPGPMSTRMTRARYLVIRLNAAERTQCLQSSDFDVDFRVIAPSADTLTAASGGSLRVTSFTSNFHSATGGACPRRLRYGYVLDLDLDGAVSAAAYQGTVEATVEQIGPGTIQTLQLPLDINMPPVLLLYHHTQINIDVQPAAVAGALGVNSSCGSGFCMAAGNQSAAVLGLGSMVPVAIDISANVPPVATRTITLNDAVGARATGCAGGVYGTASYQILNPLGGIQAGSGTITEIQSSACGFDLRTGDLSVDLDLNSISATSNASATIQITVVGL